MSRHDDNHQDNQDHDHERDDRLPPQQNTASRDSEQAHNGEYLSASAEGGSASSQPPTNDRWPRLFGFIVILIAFGGVGGWASFAKIDGAVVAQGTVTVDSYRQTVQHLEGGIVERLHVRDGDVVEQGDLLIQLDETQARAEYLMNWSRYISALARRSRLEAEIEGA
ncbi:biotin/lipoyl-binding protein [Halorhodospira halochloris]|uniref:biotin/lipoyl-binding protein n=1 Tax=Halorhodospira halochloris TaxID=1052 RepID=UPI001EE989DB|nr:biotin/lipoyl-binding protein [Halorhodospira halochloris]MCG5530547.1 biotin/lipoyl-binding protein [Halorhodospira halochloris]